MKQIAIDIVAQVLGKVFSSLLGLLAITQVCRYLSIENFGGYTLAFSFLAFFYPVVDMGLNTIAVREIARTPSKIDLVLSGAILLKVILASLAIFLITGLVYILEYSGHLRQLILVAAFSLINTVLGTFEVVLVVQQRLFWLAVSQIVSSIIFLLMVQLIIRLGWGTAAFVAAQVFSVFLSYFIVLRKINDYFRFTKPPWPCVVFLLKQSLPQGIASLVTAYYFNIDVIMISKILNETAVAYYGSACRLLAFMVFIPHAVMMSFFPILTCARQQGKKKFTSTFSFGFYLLMFIGIPLAIWATSYANPIVELIFSGSYQPAVPVFRVLVWAGVAIFASHLAGYTLVVVDRQKIGLFISLFALVSNVCLNFWLIPRAGIDGAAIATVITEFAVAMLGFGFILYFERMLPFSWKLLRVLGIAFCTIVLANLLEDINLFVSSGVFLVFFAGCFLFVEDCVVFVEKIT